VNAETELRARDRSHLLNSTSVSHIARKDGNRSGSMDETTTLRECMTVMADRDLMNKKPRSMVTVRPSSELALGLAY